MLRQNRPNQFSANPLRPTDPFRTVGYNQELRTDIPTPTDYKEDFPHLEAVTQLVPQIQNRTRNAIQVDRVEILYYQRQLTGRRCSCYTGGETSPDGLCQICWGTGIVSGYSKYGTRTELIDFTKTNVSMVNVHPAFELNTRPILFALDNGANLGYLETTVDTIANQHQVDLLQIVAQRQDSTVNSVMAFVKTFTEASFVNLTTETLKARLCSDRLIFRVQLKRIDTTQSSPLFSHIVLRYNLLDSLILFADQPNVSESLTLTELGLFDQMDNVSFVFDKAFGEFTTQDFLIRLRDMKRFKVINVNMLSPEGLLTSTTVTGRLVQQFDSYSRIP